MNFQVLARDAGLETEEFIELVELFLETSISDLESLEQALTAEDAQGIFRAAHSIKGAAVNLGIDEIFELAQGIEVKARRNCFKESEEAVGVLKGKLCMLAKTLPFKTLMNRAQMPRGASQS